MYLFQEYCIFCLIFPLSMDYNEENHQNLDYEGFYALSDVWYGFQQ